MVGEVWEQTAIEHHLSGIQELPSAVAWRQGLKVGGGLVAKFVPMETSLGLQAGKENSGTEKKYCISCYLQYFQIVFNSCFQTNSMAQSPQY